MEDFDGIMRDGTDAHDDGMPLNYLDYERQRKNTRIFYGAILMFFTVGVVVAFGYSAATPEQSTPAAQNGGVSSSPANNNNSGKTQNNGTPVTNIKSGPISVTPRQRPPGTYEDKMELQLHEDMSAFAALGMDTSIDAVTEVDVKTVISEVDVQGMQTYHSELTRVFLTMNVQGTDMECDTAQPEKAPVVDGLSICDGFSEALGAEQDFIYDTGSGKVTYQGDPNSIAAQARLSDNPVEDNLRIVGVLPGTEVSIGDTYDSSFDIGDLGSFSGMSTFKGIVHCGLKEKASTCAEFDTAGTIDLDLEAVMKSMGGGSGMGDMDSSILSGMKLTDGQMEMKVHWDDKLGFAPFSWTSMSFNLVMSNPINHEEEFVIPVNEIITVNVTTID